MKTISQKTFVVATGLLLAFNIPAFAIEGLRVSVQCSNVVMSWPSTNGETYIVQYRQTLAPTDTWQTLISSLPADTGTNVTAFVHTNVVQYPNCGGGTFSAMAANRNMAILMPSLPTAPMAIPRDGSSAGVPACLYPPGFDFSGYVIVDPVSGESVNGLEYSKARALAPNDPLFGGPEPLYGGGSGSSMLETETGFYRVVRNGVHIYGMTNGMVLNGEVQFPLELALNSTDEVVGVTFYDENNSPIIGASAQGAGNHWVLDWNTPMSYNGDYNIYAEIDFAADNPVVSAPVTVTVSNVISFPNYFSRVYGDQMWIYAQTISNASYRIDMYGQNTNYLGHFSGTADSSGTISFLWGLSGHADTNFYGVFTVTNSSQNLQQWVLTENSPTNASPEFQDLITNSSAPQFEPLAGNQSSSAGQIWIKEFPWSPGDGWAIAYSPLAVNDLPTTYSISEMMIGGDGGEYGGVVSTLGNYGLGAQMSPGNVSQSSAFEMADTNSRAQFLGYLADFKYRHCYFFGHGSPSAFGTTGAVITDADVASDLLNFPLSWLLQRGAAHPYQFVFIDGCSAGKGSLCETFGIPAITVNNQYFSNTHIQSRAFLGFKTTTSFNPQQWTWRALMLGGFFEDWIGNAPLQACVNNAVNGVHEGVIKMDSSWVIYGATDLTRYTDTTQ